jgi:hypothetical protein
MCKYLLYKSERRRAELEEGGGGGGEGGGVVQHSCAHACERARQSEPTASERSKKAHNLGEREKEESEETMRGGK